jgi:hypothetical protein
MKKKLFEKVVIYFLRLLVRYFFYIEDRISFYLKYFFKRKKVTVFLPNNLVNEKKTIAVFAIYQPKGLSFIIKRSINYLLDHNIKIILVAPHTLHPEDIDFLNKNNCTVLIRLNFGRDFASYQCGVFYLLNNKELLDSVEKIILVNDSIIFPIKENDANLQKILNLPEKVIGLTESYHCHWHICSYFILLTKDIFLHNDIQMFWRKYKPYSSRFHVIYNGEIAFGREIQKITDSYRIIYDSATLLNAFSHYAIAKNDPNFKRFFYENMIDNAGMPLDDVFHDENIDLRKIASIIEKHSILHLFSLTLIHYLDCFILKKDICYRGFFSLGYVVDRICKFNGSENFIAAVGNELRAKGLPHGISLLQRVLYLVGAV